METDERFRICRTCWGWGHITTRDDDGFTITEACSKCVGTGEELGK